jgi:nucleoside-diphosphate-sugar epimerase
MNLVIGNTAQQSFYYPDDYIKISSRNIDMRFLRDSKFDSVYVAFAEQRIYDKQVDFITPNFNYTLDIINSLIDNSNKIAIFSSCELWSETQGFISNDTSFKFDISNQYTLSKMLLVNEIKRLRNIDEKYNKIIIIHPFYFNSVYRPKYFLFGKIFDSIINRKKIEVDSLDFYRDMVHTKFLVQKVIEASVDTVVGSGKLFNVRDFIKDLYEAFNLDYYEFVSENKKQKSKSKFLIADVDWEYSYTDLLQDTIDDIKKIKYK